MPIHFKRINYLACSFVLSIIFWSILLFSQTLKLVNPVKISNFSGQLEFAVHLFTILALIPLYSKTNLDDRKVLKWFFLANVCLFLNDLSFYFSVYFQNNNILPSSFSVVLFGYIPYLLWIASIIFFLSQIFIRYIFNLSNFFKTLPFFIIVNLTITFLFFSSIHYSFYYFSWENISHIISFITEFIIFDLALLCLIYSENIGLSLSIFGFITLISGDFFVNYSFLSQTAYLMNYGELLWFLGLIFILFGILTTHKNNNYLMTEWFSRTNTIKNRLAFWSFGTSILSFLLFFIIAYFFSAINSELLLGLPIFVMVYSVIVVIFSIYMGKRFEAPFKKITANIEALMMHNDKSKIDNNFSTHEFIFLQKFIINVFEIKEQKDLAKQTMIDLITQIAHDIRSPLAAINTVLSDVTSVAENKRIMLRNAGRGINDLANLLLFHSKNNFLNSQDSITATNDYSELIFVFLDNMVTEKRYEYSKYNINIDLNVSDHSHNCFSNFNPASFKRVLSNLINNSIEATNFNGSIIVSLASNADQVEIIIDDNGCGIPHDILPKITEQGFSFNKKNGHGFGLSYAKKYLAQINGSMDIHSKEKIGTKITMRLVRANHPSWFCNSINIKHDSLVVILDDDLSIHDAWDARFSTVSHVKLIHAYNVSELLHHKINPVIPALYLVDYELLSDSKNGLDVIKDNKLNEKAILVTSCFEDADIRTQCENIGVKIIPKSYVPYIEISLMPNTEHKKILVFIDDDESMRMTWVFSAEAAGKNLITYASFDEFLNELHLFNKNTIIYIDSDLGNKMKGEVCAKQLFNKGFIEIYLATGHSKDRFAHMPWIKSIIGKEPPFHLTQESIA